MEPKRTKYTLIGLSLFCIILIGITNYTDSWLSPLRSGIGYLLVPVQTGVNTVGTAIYNEINRIRIRNDALTENERLKNQIGELTRENNRLQSETFELNRLRELYELDQEYEQYSMIGARVIAKDSIGWFQVFRINKGSQDGICVDMNVVAGGGLVGIITDVGANYATVRSIIDDVSRVSAMAMQSGDDCIVAGDLKLYEQGRLRLTNILASADIKDGDRIVTSNISSKYLPGILIGYVTNLSMDNSRLTKSGYLVPVAEFDNLQEVLVITQTKNDMINGE